MNRRKRVGTFWLFWFEVFKTPVGEFELVAHFFASKIFFPNLSPRFIRTRLLEVYPFSTWDVLDGIRMKSWDPTSWAHGKSFLAIFARLNLHAHFLLTHCLWIFFISLVFLALIGMDARLLLPFFVPGHFCHDGTSTRLPFWTFEKKLKAEKTQNSS